MGQGPGGNSRAGYRGKDDTLKIIDTSTLSPSSLTSSESLWVYNGLDTMVTAEVLEALLPQLNENTAATYKFSRDLQGAILEMNCRGILIDEDRRQSLLRQYREDIIRLSDNLNRLIREGIGFQFEITRARKNPWPSDHQLQTLFFDVMGFKEIRKRNAQGEMVRTVDRDALEKLEGNFYAEPIVRHLYALRELGKKCSFLSTAIDADGRIRTSFNIAGTNTGRLASSFSDFGTGGNLQNIENRLRAIFIAEPGYKFCNIDLEQSDARVVGAIHWNLFRDPHYLDLCESGDLHTGVARIAFRDLPWTQDPRSDRVIANGNFYREFSYRDAAKRLGHGTNYQGQPDKMSRATHIPKAAIVNFQQEYLTTFPAFTMWWEHTQNTLRDKGHLTTFLGRQRCFFGHWKDPATLREAIAYEPQSVTAETINRGLLNIWKANKVQLLNQVHDSVLFQFPEKQEDKIVPWALKQIEQTIFLKDSREFKIPAEAKTGWNWSDDPTDPNALKKWSPNGVRVHRTV